MAGRGFGEGLHVGDTRTSNSNRKNHNELPYYISYSTGIVVTVVTVLVIENTLHQLRSDLETKKANAACAMDRLEFLVSTRSGTLNSTCALQCNSFLFWEILAVMSGSNHSLGLQEKTTQLRK